MPIVKDSQGASVYKSLLDLHPVHPRFFFEVDSDEYTERMLVGCRIIRERIRFLVRPLSGRGLNNEIRADGSCSSIEGLAAFLNKIDGRRSTRLKKQRRREQKHGLGEKEMRLRSPQDVKRRRSAIFSGSDIPADFFQGQRVVCSELDQFVDRMRELILLDVLMAMQESYELVLVGDVWVFSVALMDCHRAAIKSQRRRPKSAKVKNDDRSHHGRVSSRRRIDTGIAYDLGRQQGRRAA